MADPNPTELLLKVTADKDDVSKLNTEFVTLVKGLATAAMQASQLDEILKSTTELTGIKGLLAGMAKLQADTAALAAQERQLAEQRRTAEAQRKETQRQQSAAAKQAQADAKAQAQAQKAAADEAKRIADESKRAADALNASKSSAQGLLSVFAKGASFFGGFLALNTAKDALVGFMKSTTIEGVRFNATLETSQLGIASVLKTFDPAKYKDFSSAIADAAKQISELKREALESPATFQQMLQGYQSSVGSMEAAGIPLRNQIKLISDMSRAMVALGVPTQELRQETTALLEGRIDRNSRVANILGITAADIKTARDAGTLFTFLSDRLKEFSSASKLANSTIEVLESNLKDTVQQTAAANTVELTNAYRDLLVELTTLVQSDQAKDFLRWLEAVAGLAVTAAGGLAGLSQKNKDVVNNNVVGARQADFRQFSGAADSVRTPADIGAAKKMGADTISKAVFAFSDYKNAPGGYISPETQAALGKIVADTKAKLDELERRGAEIIAANEADEKASAIRVKLKANTEAMADYNKEQKKTTAEQERQIALLDASGKSSTEVLAVLKQNEESVRAQYAQERLLAQGQEDTATAKTYIAKKNMEEEVELAKIQKQRATVTSKMNDEEFAFYQEKAKMGTSSEQIAAKEALIARITADATKDEFEKKKDILSVEREILSIRDKDRAAQLTALSELEQRKKAAAVAAIQGNPYLTTKQKQAQLYGAYQKEQAALPGWIASSDQAAAAQPEGSATRTYHMSESRRLRDRQATIGNDLQANAPTTQFQDFQRGIVDLENSFKTLGESLAESVGSALNTISESLTSVIMGTKTWGEALRDIGTSIIGGVVQSIVQMSVQWIARKIIEFALGNTLRAAAIAANVATATALSAVWAAPAALATIATFGGAAIQAPITIAGAMAATQGLALAGFSDGGFTGVGGKHEIAGVVHKGEVVFSQQDTARAGGVAAVEAMRVSGGTASSGSGSVASQTRGAPVVGESGGSVNIANFDSRQGAEAWVKSQPGRRMITDIVRGTMIEL